MKPQFAAISILLLAPAIAQAQTGLTLEKAPSFAVPRAPSQTPALDAFAGVGSELQLQARWVQIAAAALPTALPAWQKLGAGAGSHVATPEELRALQLLNSTGVASTSDQQINATNNQNANLSFSPFTRIEIPVTIPFSEPGPIDDMIIPRSAAGFEAPQTYIPNLAKPESKLPDMAPMPGIGGKYDLPFTAPLPNPSTRPQMSRELADLMAYKFQIRPTIIGQQIALTLRSLNSADNIGAVARVDYGETVVFSLPNVVMIAGRTNEIRRTFLLVTPRLAPQPKRNLRKRAR